VVKGSKSVSEETKDIALRFREQLRGYIESLPENYVSRYAACLELREAFQMEMAKGLEESLNEFCLAQPQDTLVQMRELCSRINAEARRLSLGIRCPKSGRSGHLVADYQDADHPEKTRFLIDCVQADGRKLRSVFYSFPKVALVDAGPRQEALAKWPTGGSTRGR
jgi:hypothetical protein